MYYHFGIVDTFASHMKNNKQKKDQSKADTLMPVGKINLHHQSLPQEHGTNELTRASERDQEKYKKKCADYSKDRAKFKNIEVFHFDAGVSEISHMKNNEQKKDQSKADTLMPVGKIVLYHQSLLQEHGTNELTRASERDQEKYKKKCAEQSKDKAKLKNIEVFHFNAGVSEISHMKNNKRKKD